ncbi:DNA-binding protein H-NS [Mesocricetibacter intestinalis]|uniref:DNA-binding protein n=1 Tax=Mesocricetibacter intestinalis TaxID=1521930 RepID=A0A4R6V7R6_9PAST|nr:H-NS family nucleoid-associated regulatory protein [Mesocricetibacter intestinalis]TDQ57343.1 DNA-binding protein H-NS [Mesocricetibacter intestinalis]
MTELLKTLTNIRSLRVIARELTLEQLESVLNKVQIVVEEKRAEEQENKRLAEERQSRIEKYKELLKQDGITAAELAEILGGDTPVRTRKKRAPFPPKYKYVDENGQEKTWTGQGRTPKAIQAQLDAGKPLSSFAI